jgi:DNA-binding response OmpR family regulator
MAPKKILIIEDSPDLADSLQDLLTLKGYTAIKVGNGRTGIKLAESEKPDLILLDLKLPDIEGYQVLRELRKTDWGSTVRVLVLTASDSSESIPGDLNLTEHDILRKTHWGLSELSERIKEELGS